MSEVKNVEVENELRVHLNKVLKSDTYSPYQMSKIVNHEFERDLPPQMFYNYVSKKMIPSRRIEGKIVIRRDDVISWCVKYFSRNVNK